MWRYLEPQLLRDLAGKTVELTGARQLMSASGGLVATT